MRVRQWQKAPKLILTVLNLGHNAALGGAVSLPQAAALHQLSRMAAGCSAPLPVACARGTAMAWPVKGPLPFRASCLNRRHSHALLLSGSCTPLCARRLLAVPVRASLGDQRASSSSSSSNDGGGSSSNKGKVHRNTGGEAAAPSTSSSSSGRGGGGGGTSTSRARAARSRFQPRQSTKRSGSPSKPEGLPLATGKATGTAAAGAAAGAAAAERSGRKGSPNKSSSTSGEKEPLWYEVPRRTKSSSSSSGEAGLAWYEVPSSRKSSSSSSSGAGGTLDAAAQVVHAPAAQPGRPPASRGASTASTPAQQSPSDWEQQQQQQQQQSAGGELGLPPGQEAALLRYLEYLLEVNKSMNLTAVRDPAEAWQRHILDSLALLPSMDALLEPPPTPAPTAATAAAAASGRKGRSGSGSSRGSRGRALRVIDVGTGAGLPGMVVAIVRPQWQVTLLDSLSKRCEFLKAAAQVAGVSNVEVVWSRAEEAGRSAEHREAYDVAVARAVADLRVLSELCLPLVRVGGAWVAAKGPAPEAEVAGAAAAISSMGGELLGVECVDSWSAEGQRTAVLVAKARPCPARYPRPPGTPSKKPL